ncbi:DNA (cytosine-5-)-methyltransferase [Myroides odoratimimus]|uniref:Cytosine-specific methyltransferase n=1 Tax=Myroides odoratimimus CIP 101113 TaxID=883154 RepID=A0AAV3F0J1_9FLAO|nr:DNA (cytosine-5-)-methyltransferase [Myroides odoratimimus]EHO06401.1 DNA (cytosine-5-)-methyltransferase [Myroides odoratimimus CIP 101113]SHM14364.1 DNA (cytosine-5)-methyltransferase 1 [Myroides odoratimimus subsp. xuanwuensis]
MSKDFSVGSLYAGVGGICLGFKNANFELAWANEYDKNACITYRKNFKHQLIEEDVFNVDIDSLSKVDVLAGGFPCQPFSVAGYRKGFDDHRGNHFFRILDFVDIIRPKVVFLENVKNLKTHDKGTTFKVIENALRERNYSFQSAVLNTKDYGNIPHNRERIFIVAFDKDIYPSAINEFEFPKPEELTKTIHDFLEDNVVEDRYYYREDKYMYNMLQESITSYNTVYQFRRQYVRENKSNVCPTLTANMGTGGHNVPLIKTKEGFRKLTPRECFSFQGFPKKYKLPDISNGQLYKQAGNSVSVPIIERIAHNIIKVLKKEEQ